MREDPLPDMEPNEKFYAGDNQNRVSGEALEFKQMNVHAWEAFDKGHDVHMQAAPSQAELLYNNFQINKEKLKYRTKETLTKKYGNAPRELLLGQSEKQVEYNRAGRIVKGQEASLPKSKYEEDVYINNHTCVWGSWWKDHEWGYKYCQQTVRNSYCTGTAGIEAAEAVGHLMRANIARKEATEEAPEEKRLATWGSEVPDDLVLDQKKLEEALRKEDERKREESNERKRKYNVEWDDEVTPEDMEAYGMRRIHHDDQRTNLSSSDSRLRTLKLRGTTPGANNRLDLLSLVTGGVNDAEASGYDDDILEVVEGWQDNESHNPDVPAVSHKRGLTPFVFIPFDEAETSVLNLPVDKMDYYVPG